MVVRRRRRERLRAAAVGRHDARQPHVRLVQGAWVGHRQLQLELAVGVGEVALVQVVDGDVATVALRWRVERELDLAPTERLVGTKVLPVE